MMTCYNVEKTTCCFVKLLCHNMMYQNLNVLTKLQNFDSSVEAHINVPILNESMILEGNVK